MDKLPDRSSYENVLGQHTSGQALVVNCQITELKNGKQLFHRIMVQEINLGIN